MKFVFFSKGTKSRFFLEEEKERDSSVCIQRTIVLKFEKGRLVNGLRGSSTIEFHIKFNYNILLAKFILLCIQIEFFIR